MKIRILGCRGSYPVASPHKLRYGGETTSIQVVADHTVIVLDAGTGIRHLNHLTPEIREVHLFISHLHWDHIIGFPQWALLWNSSDITLNIYGLERTHDNFYRALERSMSEPLYAHRIKDMKVNMRYHEVQAGSQVDLGQNVSVRAAYANHPYRALGYRVQHGGQALAFVPDTSPFDRYLFGDSITLIEDTVTATERSTLVKMQDALLDLIGDSDWMIYDSALTPKEYEMLPHWGHSTMYQAVEMARAGSVRELIFFHHNPGRSDDEVDAMLAEQHRLNPDLQLAAAFQGMERGDDDAN